MPELPEVEHLRRTLNDRIVGRRVHDVIVHRRDVIITPRDPIGGFSRSNQSVRPARLFKRELLLHDQITSLERFGKQLAIIGASGRVICVHLGMTGRLIVNSAGAAPVSHTHVVWMLDGGLNMSFADARRFGGVWVYTDVRTLRDYRWGLLGPDALDVDGESLRVSVHRSNRPIKAALLDQSVAAGIGNIYADEALFRAGVRPTRRCIHVRTREFAAIAEHVRAVMHEAIERGGSTIRNYVDADGTEGRAQLTHAVYGRGGQPCCTCGKPLRSATVGQRTTVWCTACQR